MKKRHLLGAFAATLALCFSLPMAAFAEDVQTDNSQQLDNVTTTGDTEVEATITDGAGEVSYIVTVPEKIDFGQLRCPDTTTASDPQDPSLYAIVKFDVSCSMTGVSKVNVGVYNEGSTAGELNQNFFLTNQTNTACTFKPVYELYVGTTKIDTSAVLEANGFSYVTFTGNQTVRGGVRLDKSQLTPYKDNMSAIAGTYSGTMVFTTSAE